MKGIAFAFVILFAFLNSAAASVQSHRESPAEVMKEAGIEQNLAAALPMESVFKDEAGQPVRLGQYFGSKPAVLFFNYFDCPMLCGQVYEGLLKSLRALSLKTGKDFEIITVSFDPKDGPAAAAAKKELTIRELYPKEPALAAQAKNGWHFLTGEGPEIERLTRAAGFHFKKLEGSDEYAHASAILIVTPDGKISRYFYGIDYAPKDLRFALIEASGGKIGSKVDQLLLLCYHYDPMTGKYGFAIQNSLRIAGLSTVALLAGFVWISLRKERARVV